MTATPIPAGVRDDTIRQLTRIRDDFRRSSVIGQEVTLSPQPQGYYSDVLSNALDLLAGPARPDGVPDDAERLIAEARYEATKHRAIHARLRSGDDLAVEGRIIASNPFPWESGVPVPPYQPDPDPEALLVEKITADWAHPDPADSATDHLEHYRTCNCLADSAECCRSSCACHAPPVAGERTGPLGLNEGDRVRHMTSGRIAAFVRYAPRGMMLVESIESGERIIYAPELWEPVRDAQPEPAETLADIAAWLRSDARDETYLTPKGMSALADRIEAASNREREKALAASRPDPDTITVNLPVDVHRRFAHACYTPRDVDAVALAAAGLPQEPTEGGES